MRERWRNTLVKGYGLLFLLAMLPTSSMAANVAVGSTSTAQVAISLTIPERLPSPTEVAQITRGREGPVSRGAKFVFVDRSAKYKMPLIIERVCFSDQRTQASNPIQIYILSFE